MGSLGQYLYDARLAKEIDLREAAQQTRISIQYLKALENEDFAKLPGEVFVKGFLKNYGRFLGLDESEVMKRYSELRLNAAAPVTAPPEADKPVVFTERENKRENRKETPIEPFVWGGIILVSFFVFLFTALPARRSKNVHEAAVPSVPSMLTGTIPFQGQHAEKVYLEVIALEDTWLLVRTDDSPQKKSVLKKGESLIWSADERFLLSYGRLGAVKLLLNGDEITVAGPRETVVRDLAVTRAGVINQPVSAKANPEKRKPEQMPAEPKPVRRAQPKPVPAESTPVLPELHPAALSPAPTPEVQPAQPLPAPASPVR